MPSRAEQVGHLCEGDFATDERGSLGRKIQDDGTRPGRQEVRVEPGMEDLVQLDGPLEVLQPVVAEAPQRGAARRGS